MRVYFRCEHGGWRSKRACNRQLFVLSSTSEQTKMIIEWRRRHQRSFHLLSTLTAIVSIGLCSSWTHPLVAVALFAVFTIVSLKVTSAIFKRQPPVESTQSSCQKTPTDSETELFGQLNRLIENVMRDFVNKWYVTIGKNEQFPAETRYVLEDFSVALVCRGRKVNRKTLIKRMLITYHSFIREYLDIAQERQKVWHVAVSRSNCEVKYLENVINVLMEILVPADVLCCGVAKKIVVAILAKSVVLPVIDLLSDPVWLNTKMIELLGPSVDELLVEDGSIGPIGQDDTAKDADAGGQVDAGKLADELHQQDGAVANVLLETNDGTQNAESDCFWRRMMDEAPSGLKSVQNEETSGDQSEKSKPHHRLPCSSSLEKIGDMVSNTLGELEMERPFEFITNNLAQYFKISNVEEGAALPAEELRAEAGDAAAEPPQNATGLNLNLTSALEKVLSMSTMPVLSDHLLNVRCKTVVDAAAATERLDLPAAQAQEQERRSSAELVAVSPGTFADAKSDSKLIDNVSIPHAETVDEPGGSGQYILYCIQYDAWYWCGDSDTAEDDGMVVSRGQVRRRFREFLALQTRLEEDPKMRPYLKGIKGINKWSMLPFGKMDKDTVSERRPVLERYLQSLIGKEEIATSVHLREFLAYGSDASIAFVRKPPDIANLPVPRIDRFLVKTMTGMFDKLKTALPSLPAEGSPPDTPPNTSQQKSSDRLLSFLSFGSDDKDPSSMTRLNFEFGFEPGTTSLESQLVEHLSQSNSSDRVECAYDAVAEQLFRKVDGEHEPPCPSPRMRKKITDEGHRIESSGEAFTPVVDSELSLASVFIDLMVEIYSTCDPWIADDKLSHFLKMVSAKTIERKLSALTDKYACESCWVRYVQLLRETLWPDGNFDTATANTVLSSAEKKKIQQKCLDAVRSTFHGVVPAVLGKWEFCKATKLFVDSLQHPQLLRNLVYQLLDIVLDSLVPETKNKSFTSKLLQRKTKV